MNEKKNRQDNWYNREMANKGHFFLFGSRVIKNTSCDRFNEHSNFKEEVNIQLNNKGFARMRVRVLESSSSYVFDMWANSKEENSGNLVGKTFCIVLRKDCINSSSYVLRRSISFAKKADWQIDRFSGNMISMGYFHGNKYDNTPMWQLDGYESRFASEYGRHDLVLEVVDVV